MNRRDLLLGAGCVAALGTAEYLRPRTTMSLLSDRNLEAILPRQFGEWRVDDSAGIVQPPPPPGSLAATLYNETVARGYRRASDGTQVMLLVAHGDSQSDLLQLHRPESCYPAVGFVIDDRKVESIPFGAAAVRAVALAMHAGGRREDVLYWTRLGEYLPVDAGEQRRDRLRTAMAGYIADGVLFRASKIREGDTPSFPVLKDFSRALVAAVPRTSDRAALIGTANARASVTAQA